MAASAPCPMAWPFPTARCRCASCSSMRARPAWPSSRYGGGTSVAGHLTVAAGAAPRADGQPRAPVRAGPPGPRSAAGHVRRGRVSAPTWKRSCARTATPWATIRSRSNIRRWAAGSPRARRASNRCAMAASSSCSRAAKWKRRPARLRIPTFPASAAGIDLREMVLGSEGRLGILTAGDGARHAAAAVRSVPRRVLRRLGARRRRPCGRWPRRACRCRCCACRTRWKRRPC